MLIDLLELLSGVLVFEYGQYHLAENHNEGQ